MRRDVALFGACLILGAPGAVRLDASDGVGEASVTLSAASETLQTGRRRPADRSERKASDRQAERSRERARSRSRAARGSKRAERRRAREERARRESDERAEARPTDSTVPAEPASGSEQASDSTAPDGARSTEGPQSSERDQLPTPDVRELARPRYATELDLHERRLAEINRLHELALAEGDEALKKRVAEMRRLEAQRHASALRRLKRKRGDS